MTEVTPSLENTRFSPFFDFTVLRPPGILLGHLFSREEVERLSDAEKTLSLMTEGNILKKLIGFAVPVFFCSVFQQLYSTVDAVIVGRFAGTEGLAAIGVTGRIIHLCIQHVHFYHARLWRRKQAAAVSGLFLRLQYCP